jgi:heparosan-N-sulfate-glucuronate 5-epimerase
MIGPRSQACSTFVPGQPSRGYYNDLRSFALRSRGRPPSRNVVTMAQIGLGAWQLAQTQPQWRPVVAQTARWLTERMDARGLMAYDFPMPHTYELDPPWYSAMAQGQAGSLLIRAGHMLEDPSFVKAAGEAVRSLLETDSGLVAVTPEGPVLQEYPTDPSAHVLNGWIFALWGLFDVASASAGIPGVDEATAGLGSRAAAGFQDGVRALSRRLPLYQLAGGWSRYDLYPHRLVNVASLFYHQLHVEQLRAMERLVPLEVFTATADVWARSASNPAKVGGAMVGKLAFRLTRTRRRYG